MIQKACSLAQHHMWFERKVAEDRKMVAERLKEHVSDPTNNPILIFPEGEYIRRMLYYAPGTVVYHIRVHTEGGTPLPEL
jgi:hypothetical protein